jgi:hypothetical protein
VNELNRKQVVSALFAGDPERRYLYLHNAHFKAEIDQLVNFIPDLIELFERRAEKHQEFIEKQTALLRQGPLPESVVGQKPGWMDDNLGETS